MIQLMAHTYVVLGQIVTMRKLRTGLSVIQYHQSLLHQLRVSIW